MKSGEFAVGNMRFHVPGAMVRKLDKARERRKAMLANGSEVDLGCITGECIFRADDIRVEQLGWLALRRYMQYVVVSEGLVAVCVE